MMMPFDIFTASLHGGISYTIDIYAGDITLQLMAPTSEMLEQAASVIERLVKVPQALELPIARDKAKILSSS
eukprot:8590262-Pyramimonas_sp.AAC.1